MTLPHTRVIGLTQRGLHQAGRFIDLQPNFAL
jgi:hypothetical protein